MSEREILGLLGGIIVVVSFILSLIPPKQETETYSKEAMIEESIIRELSVIAKTAQDIDNFLEQKQKSVQCRGVPTTSAANIIDTDNENERSDCLNKKPSDGHGLGKNPSRP